MPKPNEIMLADLEASAKAVGHLIGDVMPEGVGFMLMIFTFGEDGWTTYLSNAERLTMIEAMEEFLEKTKNDPHASQPGPRGVPKCR